MARYENFIIENKVNEYLTTKLSLSRFLTVDNSLQATDGMIKKVHKYTKSGEAETVTEGNGNTGTIGVTYDAVPYTVTTSQAKFVYSDEAEMADSYFVDKGVEALAEAIVNEYNALAIEEFEKTENEVSADALDFDAFADAIAEMNVEDEDENGMFCLVNPAMKAELRKALNEELMYVEAHSRTGYIGTVCGIPVYTSKLVSDKTAIVAKQSAVTCFMKKDIEIEQARDIDTRTNTVVARNVKVIALTDEGSCVKISVK